MEVHETANNKRVLIITNAGSKYEGTIEASNTICIAFIPDDPGLKKGLIPWHNLKGVYFL